MNILGIDYTPEEMADLRAEFRPRRRPRLRRCGDRMCGALDCPACHPLTAHLAEPDEEAESET